MLNRIHHRVVYHKESHSHREKKNLLIQLCQFQVVRISSHYFFYCRYFLVITVVWQATQWKNRRGRTFLVLNAIVFIGVSHLVFGGMRWWWTTWFPTGILYQRNRNIIQRKYTSSGLMLHINSCPKNRRIRKENFQWFSQGFLKSVQLTQDWPQCQCKQLKNDHHYVKQSLNTCIKSCGFLTTVNKPFQIIFDVHKHLWWMEKKKKNSNAPQIIAVVMFPQQSSQSALSSRLWLTLSYSPMMSVWSTFCWSPVFGILGFTHCDGKMWGSFSL